MQFPGDRPDPPFPPGVRNAYRLRDSNFVRRHRLYLPEKRRWPRSLLSTVGFRRCYDIVQMRSFIRQPTRLSVEVTAIGDPIASCRLVDIGLGGFCCETDHTIPAGTRLGLQLPSGDRPLHAQGEVSWCRRCGDDFRIGVRFVSTDPESRLHLVERVCDLERQRRLARGMKRGISPDPSTSPGH